MLYVGTVSVSLYCPVSDNAPVLILGNVRPKEDTAFSADVAQ